MFFNVGPAELFIVGLVLLIVVGPEQLPGVARNVGRTFRRVRDMSLALRADFMSSLDEPIVPDKPNSSTESKEPPTFLDKQDGDTSGETAGEDQPEEPPIAEIPEIDASDETVVVDDDSPEPEEDGILP